MRRLDRLTCEEVFQRLEDYVDKELTLEEVQRVNEHLAICEVCASEYKFQAEMLAAVKGRVQRLAVPATLRSRISEALKQTQ